jgi:YD repeat-containing protein
VTVTNTNTWKYDVERNAEDNLKSQHWKANSERKNMETLEREF